MYAFSQYLHVQGERGCFTKCAWKRTKRVGITLSKLLLGYFILVAENLPSVKKQAEKHVDFFIYLIFLVQENSQLGQELKIIRWR